MSWNKGENSIPIHRGLAAKRWKKPSASCSCPRARWNLFRIHRAFLRGHKVATVVGCGMLWLEHAIRKVFFDHRVSTLLTFKTHQHVGPRLKKAKVLVPAVGLELRFLGSTAQQRSGNMLFTAGCPTTSAKGPTPPAAF